MLLAGNLDGQNGVTAVSRNRKVRATVTSAPRVPGERELFRELHHAEEGQLPRVTVVGTGYLGLTHAVCLADLGHEVLAIDVDADKIALAGNGEVPFFEPGLEPLLRKNLDAGRLRFTLSFAEVGAFGE